MKNVAAHVPAVTLGTGLTHPQGQRLPLKEASLVTTLIGRIESVDEDEESWWSPHLFKGDYRKKENWEFSIGFGVDLDYYAANLGHCPPEAEVRERLAKVPFDANFMHQTPRGARVVGVAQGIISDPELYHHAALGFVAPIERALAEACLLGSVRLDKACDGKVRTVVDRPGYVVDRGALLDRARLFYSPSAKIRREAEARRADVVVLDTKCFDARALAETIRQGEASPAAMAPRAGYGGLMSRMLSALSSTPKAKHRSGHGVSIVCPYHGDSAPSAVVFERSGAFHCSVCTPHLSLRGWVDTDGGRQLLGDALVGEVLSAGRSPARGVRSHVPNEPVWPAPLAQAAFHGIVGEFVRVVEPHTEADPAALLLQLLVVLANVVGRKIHVRVESTKHFLVLFLVLVGPTAKGRKGTAWERVIGLLPASADPWKKHRIVSGLSSGEGLIWTMRDPQGGNEDDEEEKGAALSNQDEKRLMIVEPEFARVLRVLERDGNTLSAIIRQAWDSGTLRVMTKKNPVAASNVHVSIVGHITRDEFRRYFRTTEAANGFANRFLLACAKRARVLPFGGNLDPATLAPFTKRLDDILLFAEEVDPNDAEATLGPDARTLWAAVYPALSEGRAGMVGAVTARAEAQALRIAAVYAVLDKSLVIDRAHLEAALAIVAYAEASARYVFDNAARDAVADEILSVLQRRPDGMTRTELRDLFDRNKSGEEVSRALDLLHRQGLASMRTEKTSGRPAERWGSTGAAATPTTETTLTTEAPTTTPLVVKVVSVVPPPSATGPLRSTEAPEPCVRRVNYADLSAFQRDLFDAHGTVHGVEVTDAVAPSVAVRGAV